MPNYKLSIVIPARNEVCYDIDLLSETVKNLLENTTDLCQLIAVLDGYWPNVPLPARPRLQVIHHNQSIGQRAATNEGVRIATGEWVCKMDAHCAVGPEFDVKLLEGVEPHWTVVPGQFNLQAFEWHCKRCDWIKDQSPKPPKCEKCGSRYVKQVKIWKPRDGQEGRRRAYTHSWRFDSNLDFQYFGAYAADEKHCKKHNVPFRPETQQPIHDTMSLLGACWAMTKERYLYLDPCDPAFGSWGDMGTEISCKTWLSGGELKVNQNTWFAHFFRVGGLGFPYPDGGRKERAKARGKELWLKNLWPKQIYPLSWLLDKFSPLPDWDTPGNLVRAAVNEEGALFHSKLASISDIGVVGANLTDSLSASANGKQVALDAVGFSRVDDRAGVRVSANIQPVIGDQPDMGGIAARGVITDNMIQNRNTSPASTGNRLNQPSVHEPMGEFGVGSVLKLPVSLPPTYTNPQPAVTATPNSGENSSQFPTVNMSYNEPIRRVHGLTIPRTPSVGYLYYTCNSHDELLELAMRSNLLRAKKGNEIGCVALRRTDFGDWSIVLDRQKSGATMHYQILAGLERMRSEFVFLCESDVAYHESHFDFVPPDDSTFYYNTNVWRVRYEDGHAVRTVNLQQVSGICAHRKLLLDHYRRRVETIEQNDGKFDTKRMAYEPGTRGKFGDERVANWQSPYPNIDVTGHGNTLTVPHFSVDSFRNKKYAEGWMETDEPIAGWGLIYGRVQEWLREMVGR